MTKSKNAVNDIESANAELLLTRTTSDAIVKLDYPDSYVYPKNTTVNKRVVASSLRQFLEEEDAYSTKRIVYKRKVFSLALNTHEIDLIYDPTASRTEKLRRILQSTQLNLFIIALIIFDWIIGVGEIIEDLIKTNQLSDFNFQGFEDTVEYISLSILTIFLLEILLKIVLLPKVFFVSCLELLDALIVISSFVVEILNINRVDYSGIGSVLTIFRFWRILRIVNRVILAVEKQIRFEIFNFKSEIRKIVEENKKLKKDLEQIVYVNMLTDNLKLRED